MAEREPSCRQGLHLQCRAGSSAACWGSDPPLELCPLHLRPWPTLWPIGRPVLGSLRPGWAGRRGGRILGARQSLPRPRTAQQRGGATGRSGAAGPNGPPLRRICTAFSASSQHPRRRRRRRRRWRRRRSNIGDTSQPSSSERQAFKLSMHSLGSLTRSVSRRTRAGGTWKV